MLPVVTAAQMAVADKAAIEHLRIGDIRLMELAGARMADIARELLEKDSPDTCSFLVVCGKGNNGGDGFVLARHLLNSGARVDLVLLYPRSTLSEANRSGLDILAAYAKRTERLRIFTSVTEALPFVMETPYDALFDAVLGTGLKIAAPQQPLHAPVSEGIELLSSLRLRGKAPLIAVDLPSGLDASSGFSAEPSVTADLTITMAFLKTGFFFNDGPRLSGEIRTAEISIPEFLLDPSTCRLTNRAYASGQFVLREPSGAKHLNGKVLVVAGSHAPHSSILGAAMLSVKAALKTGAGYVCSAIPLSGSAALHTFAPEAIVIDQEIDRILEKAEWADALLIGCGLGREPANIALVRELLRIPAVAEKKLVLDADALYAISGTDILQEERNFTRMLLTPHYGEFSRLSGIPADKVAADPLNLAADFARHHRINLLLKGHPTVLAGADGSLMINNTGTEALSTAGSGDVLAGMIVALAAKGAEVTDAGAAAAWFHGRAGDLADDVSSLVSAEGILNAIPAAIHEIFDIEE